MYRLFVLIMIVATTHVSNVNPILKWNEKVHDFGAIKVDRGKSVTAYFIYENQGKTNIVLYDVKASCNCTKVKWSKKPLKEGQKDTIVVSINSKDVIGFFDKKVYVRASDSKGLHLLRIKGKLSINNN